MTKFDELQVAERLARLDPVDQLVFAALAAESLFPLYARFVAANGSGGADELRHILDSVWELIEGEAEIAETSDGAASRAPEDGGPSNYDYGYAQNAAIAVAYAVDAVNVDRSLNASLAGLQVFDAADYAGQALESDDASLLTAAAVQFLDGNIRSLEALVPRSQLVESSRDIADAWLTAYPRVYELH